MARYAPLLGLAAAWIVVLVVFGLLVPGGAFVSLRNGEVLLRQTVIVGFAAIGMTFVIINGQVDLSVGSLVALITVVIARFLSAGQPEWAALAAAAGVGLLAGAMNGAAISRLRAGSFVVTLGALLLFRGIAKGLAGESTVPTPPNGLTDIMAPASISGVGVAWGVWVLAGAAILAAWILRGTVFGRNVVAVGSNEEAARLAGVPVSRIRIGVFALAGLFFAVSGLMQYARLRVGDPTAAAGLELEAIAAVVIGGASLSGGTGSIAGSLIGALIMATIRSGCSQMGWPNWIQEIVTGLIIVSAVGIDRWRQARIAR